MTSSRWTGSERRWPKWNDASLKFCRETAFVLDSTTVASAPSSSSSMKNLLNKDRRLKFSWLGASKTCRVTSFRQNSFKFRNFRWRQTEKSTETWFCRKISNRWIGRKSRFRKKFGPGKYFSSSGLSTSGRRRKAATVLSTSVATPTWLSCLPVNWKIPLVRIASKYCCQLARCKFPRTSCCSKCLSWRVTHLLPMLQKGNLTFILCLVR